MFKNEIHNAFESKIKSNLPQNLIGSKKFHKQNL